MIVLVALCILAGASIAVADAFKVIVHPDTPVTALDRDFLRDAYLKKTTEWHDGKAVRPIDLSSKFPARDRFAQDVIRKTPSQLKSYWNQQIFSGKGVPPPEADTVADLINYVLANPGAIGYLPADVDSGRAKVVKVN
jgi:ABC-type phosphate transport system substrate-binding protein